MTRNLSHGAMGQSEESLKQRPWIQDQDPGPGFREAQEASMIGSEHGAGTVGKKGSVLE